MKPSISRVSLFLIVRVCEEKPTYSARKVTQFHNNQLIKATLCLYELDGTNFLFNSRDSRYRVCSGT